MDKVVLVFGKSFEFFFPKIVATLICVYACLVFCVTVISHYQLLNNIKLQTELLSNINSTVICLLHVPLQKQLSACFPITQWIMRWW